MSVKTAGVGHFTIPTAPAAGASCTSGAANVFTTTYVQLIASTSAALFITGIYVEEAAVTAGTYIVVQLATGGAGSETIVGQHLIAPVTGSTVTRAYKSIFPPIPVANATRISCKTADSVGAQAKLITLECIAQSNVVDDGIAVGTVTTVTNQLTAAAIATGIWQDTTAGDFTTALSVGKSLMNGVALGTGLTVNSLTNLPSIPANWLTAAGTAADFGAEMAAAVWQDTTAGDFTVASSIGKALYTGNVAPGGSGGLMISGANAGTTTLGALTITGVTTHTGNVVLSDGLTISAPSTGNRAGLDISGNGTGAALKLVAGATGAGLSVAGGGTSGDGIKVTTTSGHGVNLAPVGTSMHGLFATGGNGGTSDGIKAAAGTGGVDFRANQTGNLTGNISGSVGSVTGAVGSVTGAVASVTARVTANADQLAGQTVTAAAGVTFPASVASPTNITAASGISLAASQHVIVDSGTVTTLTNLPAITAGWLTATGIAAGALNGKGDWLLSSGYTAPDNTRPTNFAALAITAGGLVSAGTVSDKTGYALTAGYDPAKTAAQAGDAMTLTAPYDAAKTAAPASTALTNATWTDARAAKVDNLDVAVSTRNATAPLSVAGTRAAIGMAAANLDTQIATLLPTAGYTAPDNAGIAGIRAQTDKLTFTMPLKLDVGVYYINGVALAGAGAVGDLWRPA